MIPKKLIVNPIYDEFETFEVVVSDKARYPNDYKIEGDDWDYFQYDSVIPGDYVYVFSYRGYLIKTNKGKNNIVLEVVVKIIE